MAVAIKKITQEIKRLDMWNVHLGSNRGSVQSGERPCVVISNNIGNKYSPVVIVAPVTSRVKKEMPTHVKVCGSDAGLYSDSIVLLEQIMTISKDQLDFKITELPDKYSHEIVDALSVSLAMR